MSDREIIISQDADNRQEWNVFTDDPVMVRKLEAIGATRTDTRGESTFWTIRADQILLRRGKRQVSEANRQAARERLAAARAARQVGE